MCWEEGWVREEEGRAEGTTDSRAAREKNMAEIEGPREGDRQLRVTTNDQ